MNLIRLFALDPGILVGYGFSEWSSSRLNSVAIKRLDLHYVESWLRLGISYYSSISISWRIFTLPLQGGGSIQYFPYLSPYSPFFPHFAFHFLENIHWVDTRRGLNPGFLISFPVFTNLFPTFSIFFPFPREYLLGRY